MRISLSVRGTIDIEAIEKEYKSLNLNEDEIEEKLRRYWEEEQGKKFTRWDDEEHYAEKHWLDAKMRFYPHEMKFV